jgi:hypothetical protein
MLSRHQSWGLVRNLDPDYWKSDGRRMNVIDKTMKDSGSSTRMIVRSSLVPMLENTPASHGFKMTVGKTLNPSLAIACCRREISDTCQG